MYNNHRGFNPPKGEDVRNPSPRLPIFFMPTGNNSFVNILINAKLESDIGQRTNKR